MVYHVDGASVSVTSELPDMSIQETTEVYQRGYTKINLLQKYDIWSSTVKEGRKLVRKGFFGVGK